MVKKYALSVSTLLLNIYYICSWKISFTKFSEQLERKEYFVNNYLFGVPVGTVELILLLLNITALYVVFKNGKSVNSIFKTIIGLSSSLYIAFLIWTHL